MKKQLEGGTHSSSANDSNAMITNYIASCNKIQAPISFTLLRLQHKIPSIYFIRHLVFITLGKIRFN